MRRNDQRARGPAPNFRGPASAPQSSWSLIRNTWDKPKHEVTDRVSGSFTQDQKNCRCLHGCHRPLRPRSCERLSGIHTNAHYAAALRQRIRDLIGAKQSGFMPENGGLQCTNVRIPDSLSVIKSIRGADADTPESNRSSSKTPSRIASSGRAEPTRESYRISLVKGFVRISRCKAD